MIKGAKIVKGKFNGNSKQVCPVCKTRMPINYNWCLNCKSKKAR